MMWLCTCMNGGWKGGKEKKKNNCKTFMYLKSVYENTINKCEKQKQSLI